MLPMAAAEAGWGWDGGTGGASGNRRPSCYEG